MTTYEEPHLGWHTVTWGSLRRWWVHRREHKSGDLNAGHQWCHRTDEDTDVEVEAPEVDPEELEATPPRWRGWAQAAQTVGLWCVGALVVVIAVDPAPWLLALVIGCGGAGLVLQRTAHRRAVEQLTHQLNRETSTSAARAQRTARQRQNRAEREARDEAARAAREAKRAANQEAHRGAQGDG